MLTTSCFFRTPQRGCSCAVAMTSTPKIGSQTSYISKRRKSSSNLSKMSVPRVRKRTGLAALCPDWCPETPSVKSERGRTYQMFYLILLPIIPVVVLAINSTYRLVYSVGAVVHQEQIVQLIEVRNTRSPDVGTVLHSPPFSDYNL